MISRRKESSTISATSTTSNPKDKTSVSKKFNYETDGQGNDGMQTAVWGPILWTFLHILSFNYPVQPSKEQKSRHRQFIESLQHVLPCRACRENISANMDSAGYDPKVVFENRIAFSQFVFRLHNSVNRQLGKKEESDYNEVAERFEKVRAKCTSAKKSSKKRVHKGCIRPFHGKTKIKCRLLIEPQDESASCIVDQPSLCFSVP